MDPAGGSQTSGGGPGEPRALTAGSRLDGRRVAAVVCLLCLLGVTLVLAAGPTGATVPPGQAQSGNDTVSPELGNLTKVDETTVDLEITDDSDVNESSIEPADFALSAGNVSGVETSENGTDALVTIALAGPIDDDQLHVTIAEDRNVTDAAGNELTADDTIGRRVYQMDGRAPSVGSFSVDDEGGAIGVRIETSESLDGLSVDLSGPADLSMGLADFSSVVAFDEYEGTVTPPASGEYTVRLVSVRDDAGNVREVNVSEAVEVDVTAPDARARVDYGNSEGLSVTFDATRSTDNEGIANVTWDLGDGETATGERVTHRYDPGNYTVEATVSDEAGNAGTDRLRLNLTGEQIVATRANTTGARSVSIDGGGTESQTAIVDVTDADAGATVRVTRDVGDGAPIVATENVSLETVTVALTTNASYRLGIQSEPPEAVADVTGATDGEPLAGLTVVHDVDDAVVRNVTFEVTVAAEALDETDGVAMFRHGSGEWRRLPTRRLNDTTGAGNGTNATVRYRATSPGLSRFAVATVPGEGEGARADQSDSGGGESGDASDDSPVAVTAASLNETAVDPGQPVRVEATVASDRDNATSFTAGLTVDGTVDQTESVEVPAGGTTTVAFAYATDENGSYALAVNGTSAGTLTVGDAGDGTGLLRSVLGVFGFLPLGLLRTLVTYVGGVLAVVFLLLKALALYLGY